MVRARQQARSHVRHGQRLDKTRYAYPERIPQRRCECGFAEVDDTVVRLRGVRPGPVQHAKLVEPIFRLLPPDRSITSMDVQGRVDAADDPESSPDAGRLLSREHFHRVACGVVSDGRRQSPGIEQFEQAVARPDSGCAQAYAPVRVRALRRDDVTARIDYHAQPTVGVLGQRPMAQVVTEVPDAVPVRMTHRNDPPQLVPGEGCNAGTAPECEHVAAPVAFDGNPHPVVAHQNRSVRPGPVFEHRLGGSRPKHGAVPVIHLQRGYPAC